MMSDVAEHYWFPRTSAEQQAVLSQLDRILASQHFRQSKRSAVLLRFLVEKTVQGQEAVLKERTLGIEVFGRRADYDTSADPVVRMSAGEIRKRIAQYYHDQAHESELRIDLAPGSYVVRFSAPRAGTGLSEIAADPHTQGVEISVADALSSLGKSPSLPVPPKEEPIARGTHKRLILFIGIMLLILAASSILLPKHKSYVTGTWGPVLDGSNPVLICVGEPKLYVFSAPSADKRPMTTGEHVQTGDTITYSEAQTLVRLVTTLNSHQRQYNLQAAGDTTFSELRKGPVVLLGGLNNPWTMRAQKILPIRLATDGDGFNWIEDTHHPSGKNMAVDSHLPYSNLTRDYAIVARFYDPNSQEPTLIVAGLGENGTKAAGELITDEEELHHLIGDSLENAGNFELLLETQVINGASGPPKVLAKEVW